jgi:hypothetical protein
MFNIKTELPCGAVSRGYERKNQQEASLTFIRVVQQCREFKNYIIDVILMEDGIEIQREHVNTHAAR